MPTVPSTVTAAAPPPPPPLDITQTVGMFAIGNIMGTLFYGMVLLQAGLYFGKNRQNNSRRTSILVLLLVSLDTLSWLSETYSTWFYFVKNYDNPSQLGTLFWELQIEPIFTYSATFLAQMFFIEKIWLLTKSHILGAGLTLVAMIAWVTGIAIDGLILSQHALVTPTIDKVNIVQKTTSTIIEVAIGTLMTFLLRRRKGGFKETDNLLNSLIVFALTRGLVLTSVQVAYTAVFFGYPDKLYWVVFQFCLAKIGSNSVLASLNVRELINDANRPVVSSNNVSGHIHFRPGGTSTGRTFVVNSQTGNGVESVNNIALQSSGTALHATRTIDVVVHKLPPENFADDGNSISLPPASAFSDDDVKFHTFARPQS